MAIIDRTFLMLLLSSGSDNIANYDYLYIKSITIPATADDNHGRRVY